MNLSLKIKGKYATALPTSSARGKKRMLKTQLFLLQYIHVITITMTVAIAMAVMLNKVAICI